MCYNCGCFNPQDKMGHDDNITDHTLEELAKKRGKSLEDTKKELLQAINEGKVIQDPELKLMFEKASKAWGQPIEEAISNAKDLLEQDA